MNSKQRMRNRATARALSQAIAARQVCPECGEVVGPDGGHWIVVRHVTVEDQINAHHTGVGLNPDDFGFWTCAKFYEPSIDGKPGKRKAEFINPRFTGEGMMAGAMGVVGALAVLMESGSKGIAAMALLNNAKAGLTPLSEEEMEEILGLDTPEQKAALEKLQTTFLRAMQGPPHTGSVSTGSLQL